MRTDVRGGRTTPRRRRRRRIMAMRMRKRIERIEGTGMIRREKEMRREIGQSGDDCNACLLLVCGFSRNSVARSMGVLDSGRRRCE